MVLIVLFLLLECGAVILEGLKKKKKRKIVFVIKFLYFRYI